MRSFGGECFARSGVVVGKGKVSRELVVVVLSDGDAEAAFHGDRAFDESITFVSQGARVSHS
jgi:hypothetical protein